MLRKAFVFILLAALAAVPALAVQATTQINLDMPSLVILYFRSAVNFTVADTDLSGAMLAGANPNTENAAAVNGFGGDAGVTGADFSTTATATVQNFWGVRSFAGVGSNTRVTVSVSSATLNNGASAITLSNPRTDLAGAGTFAADNIVFLPTGFALQLGDLQFDADMSAMTLPGNHTGGAILIDAVIF
jgi:hypothetical protein